MSTFQSKSSINSYCIGRATKRLHNEYKKFMESPPENITVAFQEDLILRWHFLFSGLNGTLFDGGEYHGVLMFPQDYPFSPPSIQFITPNGRFKTGERVCFALSEFHPEYWKPAYTVSAVLQGVYSFMMSETTDTVGSLDVDESEIKELAGKSREFNLQDGCTDLFQDEMKAALSDDSNVDTDTPLPQKSQFYLLKPTEILVKNDKEGKQIPGEKRKSDLKDGFENLPKKEIKIEVTKLSDTDTNPLLNKKRKEPDNPSPQKSDYNSSLEILEQDVQFCESKDDEKVSIILSRLPDEQNKSSEMDPILKKPENICTSSSTSETISTMSFGASKKEKLAAKSSSGKDKLDKYKSTRKFKSEANYQFSSKSLSQSDQINTKSSEMLKGSKLVNSSLTSKFSKSPFNLKYK